MNYEITYSKKSVKQLKKIHSKDAERIVLAVAELSDYLNASNVISLTNHDYDYRLRVGDYRVFFNVFDDVEIVLIEEVKKRDERTY